MKKRNKQTKRLGIESLEKRALMAGNVIAGVDAHGALYIQGDHNANEVLISEVGTNMFQIQGINTTINGVASLQRFFAPRDGIAVNMNGGNDVLRIINSDIRSLQVDASWGIDALIIDQVIVRGTGNSARIDMGYEGQVERDQVSIKNSHFFGNLTVGTGAGNDHVQFSNSQVNYSLVVNGGSGYDTYSLFKTRSNVYFGSTIIKNFEKRL